MVRQLIRFFILLAVLLGISNPAFAMKPGEKRPIYLNEYRFASENLCEAVAIVPYEGDVLYKCQSGGFFWSDVLVAPLTLQMPVYLKNRESYDDAAAAAS